MYNMAGTNFNKALHQKINLIKVLIRLLINVANKTQTQEVTNKVMNWDYYLHDLPMQCSGNLYIV